MAKGGSNRETWIGMSVLLVLAGIGTGVYIKQFHYDPAIFKALSPERDVSRPADSGPSGLEAYAPEGMASLTPVETFGPETLSDKIDGKAELYLSAGFVNLRSQRFTSSKDASSWIEAFVYDMGSTRNAFSVYSAQRRAGAADMDLTRFAYRTPNALFFVHGPNYVEIVAPSAAEDVALSVLAFGRNFVAITKIPAGSGADDLGDFALLPRESLDPESITLLASDVFGFDRLNNVLAGTYAMDGKDLTAFVSSRETASEASGLAEAYFEFLIQNGGTEASPGPEIPGAKLVGIMDGFELIFSKGRVLAGVHDADARESAERLGLLMYRGLPEDRE